MADGSKYVFTPCDDMSMKIKHLSALTLSITGEGFDSFKTMSEDNQQNLLWLANELAFEIRDLFGKMIDKEAGKPRQGSAATELGAR